VLRPVDLEEGHGFIVAIARTPQRISASVHFDAYAGRLVRIMSDADDESRTAMRSLIDSAQELSLIVYCSGEPAEDPTGALGTWNPLEVEVSARLPRRCDEGLLRKLAVDCVSYAFALPLCLMQVEEIDGSSSAQKLPEGALKRVEVNRYERSPANRAACLAFHGARCLGCGFDFGQAYGPIAAGFIEVHHTVPVSRMGSGYLVDPVHDLVPLCSNCHSVVHRRDPPLTLDELKALIGTARKG
jgi:5-methylcytosine-specific restriction protein A